MVNMVNRFAALFAALCISGAVPVGAVPALLQLQARSGGPRFAWQTDWTKFVIEIGKHLASATNPFSETFKAVFQNQEITWEGKLRDAFTGKKDERVQLVMTPVEIRVALRLFSFRETSQEVSPVGVTLLTLTPTAVGAEAWTKVPRDTKVRFRANTGTALVLLTERGNVFISVERGELIH